MPEEALRLRWSGDPSQLAWALPLLDDLATATVAVRVPRGFPAYARILHPIPTNDGDLSWREVAMRHGKTVHPTSGWRSLAVSAGGAAAGTRRPRYQPTAYRTPKGVLDVLVEHLSAATTTPARTVGATWDGYGWRMPIGDPESAAVIHLCGNPHAVFTGPTSDIAALEPAAPNLWFPDDRAWVVGRFIEDASTYVGGSVPLIEGILSDDRLEAVTVQPQDVIGTDETNSPPLAAP